MQQVLDKPYANITIDAANKVLYQKWNGYVNVPDFKAAIDVSVDCFREQQLHYILSDTTDQAVLAKEGSDYAASVMPELIRLGLKKVAFVLPKSNFTKLSVDNFTKATDQRFVRYFPSREEAEKWLLNDI